MLQFKIHDVRRHWIVTYLFTWNINGIENGALAQRILGKVKWRPLPFIGVNVEEIQANLVPSSSWLSLTRVQQRGAIITLAFSP